MRIRESTLRDLPALTRISIDSLAPLRLYKFLFPDRLEYPKDFHDWWAANLKQHILEPGTVVMVIESEPRDSDVNGSKGDGQVIGYAVWLLWPRGKGEKGVVLPGVKRKGFGDAIERKKLTLSSYFALNRSHSGIAFADWERAITTLSSDTFREPKYREHLHLKYIAVDPKWQSRGAGRMLMKWSEEQAVQAGGLPILAEAVEEAEGFFEALGWRELKNVVVGEAVTGVGLTEVVWELDAVRKEKVKGGVGVVEKVEEEEGIHTL